jgi:hypothetical protein
MDTAFGLPKGRIFGAIEQNEITKLSSEHGREGWGVLERQ